MAAFMTAILNLWNKIMWNERTITLLGIKSAEILEKSKVAVFGVGGVGSYAVECLARAGIGSITLVDDDVYSETNLNRQLYATLGTLGKPKTDVAKERILSINPLCSVVSRCMRYNAETCGEFDLASYDYVVDAIDSLDCKTLLIKNCVSLGVKIISSMGAGNRRKPQCFEVADIYSTVNDPLAKALRQRLRKEGVKKLKTVFSAELPSKAEEGRTVGSLSCVTAAAGTILAGEVINGLIGEV